MTAPDKIYIRESNVGLSDMWYYEKRLLPSIFATHEYIRKDKILEVLKSFSNPTTKLFVQSIIESLNDLK